DPLGALVAVLVFEFIQSSGGNFTIYALTTFLEIVFIGVVLGGAAAFSLYWMIKKDWIPHFLLNIFTLASVLCVFVASDQLAHESGLLSVVIMGMIMGNLNVPRLREILNFKESLSILLVSILFILLAANIDLSQLELLLDWRALGLFLLVALVLRPLGVLLSTIQSDLSLNEKIFISWVGPRGIVAAGIASLFGITLTNEGVEGAEYITPLVFMIVLGTVLLNATTARLLAKLLDVIQASSSGILFIGANPAARLLAKYLQEQKRHIVLADSNPINVSKAREDGIEAFVLNIYNDDLSDQLELLDIGYLIAMTSSSEVNDYAIKRYQKLFGEKGIFRLLAPEELRQQPNALPQEGIFSYTDDFLNLNEIARDYPEIHEIAVENKEQLVDLVKGMAQSPLQAPIFIKEPSGVLQPIPCRLDEIKINAQTQLVYMGRKAAI
ncbi:MAG: cation:proton antiporter, partial [Saprospiraceae bacterium]